MRRRSGGVTGNRLLGVPTIRLLTPGNQVRWRAPRHPPIQ